MTDMESPKRRLMLPLLLSVFFPGLGQLVQKRWLPGACYVVAGFVASSWFFSTFRPILDAYLQVISDPEHAQAPASIDTKGMAISFVLYVVVTLVNIGDVVRGARRAPPSPPAV
jgi:hypothetical protein